ncbi:glycosyltransferase family 4 protein [bacterium]|nr:glycosyltransferase family 4 protein [bacterium]
MKILYFIDKPNMYGSERHLLDIISFFSKSNDVALISFAKGEMLKYIENININTFHIGWLPNINIFLIMLRYLKLNKPELIHCHQPKATFIGSIIGRLLGIPVIVTIHSKAYDHVLVHNNFFKKIVVYLFHKITTYISELLASKIVYVNKTMYVNASFKNKSIYISNWLNPNLELNSTKKLATFSNVNFLSIGSITKAKGYDLLFDFFEYLKINNFNFNANIYGGIQGDLYEKNKERLLPLKEVVFHGFKTDLKQAYREADIYVLFSRSETFGLTYLEAMSQGLPIICLDLDELINLIPNDNILVKDIEEAYFKLQEILNKKTYEYISQINTKRSQEYLYDDKMKELHLIYENHITK